MAARELQADYEALKKKDLAGVGRLLADAGASFDAELNAMLRSTRNHVQSPPEFAVWMAEALAWARYARRDGRFFVAAANFIDGGDASLLDEASEFPDRFGADRLREALAAFGRWFTTMRPQLIDITPEPLRWKALQERSLRVAEKLKDGGQLRGVGLWLFPAPFKIMAIAHRESWKDPALDALVMPIGTQVERALRRLHADAVIKIDRRILDGGDGTFADEYTNLWAQQLPQKALAANAGSSVLHINGALHELGERWSR